MLLYFRNFSTKFLQKCLKPKQGSLILLGGAQTWLGQTWQEYLMCLTWKLKAALSRASFTSRNIETKWPKKLASESSEVFKSLCHRLLESQSPDAYHEAKTQMDQFINSAVERAFLKSWLAWWHDRRGFIFEHLPHVSVLR